MLRLRWPVVGGLAAPAAWESPQEWHQGSGDYHQHDHLQRAAALFAEVPIARIVPGDVVVEEESHHHELICKGPWRRS
jgi:hypothetical protein